MTAFGGNNTSGPIDVAAGLNAKGGAGRMDFDSETFIAHSLRGEGFDASEDGTGRGTPLVPVGVTIHGTDGTARAASYTDTAGCLRTKPPGSIENSSTTVVQTAMQVRRLTPRECERLQGFPDDYTAVPHRGKPAADGPRYKALGNSWAVPCARWIGARINQLDAIANEHREAA